MRPGPHPGCGWYGPEAFRSNFRVVATEFLSEDVVKYSYTLLANSEVLLRYDNAPHHPEVPTHPRGDLGGEVRELRDRSVEAFLREATGVIGRAGRRDPKRADDPPRRRP